MSDTKLRDLELRWKQTSTVDDEAAYLVERVRVGDLSRENLELAAYCGHEGARRATNSRRGPDDAREFVTGLAAFGPPTLMSAGLAMAHACLPLMGSDRGVAVLALAEKEAWVRCPCLDHAKRVRSPLQLHVGVIPAGNVVVMACQAPKTIRVNERGRGEVADDPLEAARHVVNVALRQLGDQGSRRAICERLVSEALR